eukprot:COSAG02_NODE_52650_length_306_cov_1.053140_1_plen_46_part_01
MSSLTSFAAMTGFLPRLLAGVAVGLINQSETRILDGDCSLHGHRTR